MKIQELKDDRLFGSNIINPEDEDRKMSPLLIFYNEGDKPSLFDLEIGDLAYNVYDKALYTRGNQNDIIRIL